jgi:succinate dehydrogenase / fumarate reductase, cytochrome b subunit
MAMPGRPLSPHLQIYRWYLSMGLSIAHRATGLALVVGLLFMTWWLYGLAAGPEAFATVQDVAGSILGQLVLFGLTFCFFLHLATGVRHLVWDFGYGYELRVAYQSGLVAIGAAAALTLILWIALLVAG